MHQNHTTCTLMFSDYKSQRLDMSSPKYRFCGNHGNSPMGLPLRYKMSLSQICSFINSSWFCIQYIHFFHVIDFHVSMPMFPQPLTVKIIHFHTACHNELSYLMSVHPPMKHILETNWNIFCSPVFELSMLPIQSYSTHWFCLITIMIWYVTMLYVIMICHHVSL